MSTNADGTEAIELLVEKERTLKDYHEQIMSLLENDEDIASEIEYHNNSRKKHQSHLINV